MTGQGSFDLAAVARGIRLGRHHWGLHVLERMVEREIAQADVLAVLQGGEVIKEYPDDTPFPSALILGFVSSGPLHAVVALDASGPDPYIITVYRPSPDKFEPDWKTRRRR